MRLPKVFGDSKWFWLTLVGVVTGVVALFAAVFAASEWIGLADFMDRPISEQSTGSFLVAIMVVVWIFSKRG